MPVCAGVPEDEPSGVVPVLPAPGFGALEGLASSVLPGLLPAALTSNSYMFRSVMPPQLPSLL